PFYSDGILSTNELRWVFTHEVHPHFLSYRSRHEFELMGKFSFNRFEFTDIRVGERFVELLSDELSDFQRMKDHFNIWILSLILRCFPFPLNGVTGCSSFV